MTPHEIRGLYPATVTPFTSDLRIDEGSLLQHLQYTARAAGVEGVVVNGHIAEVSALSSWERQRCVEIARAAVRPGQPVFAGIDGRTAADLVRDGLNAREAGADGLLVLPPMDVRTYRRLSAHPAALMHYIEALDKEVGLPLILHQYPKATGASYSLEVLEAVADMPSLVAIKAAALTVTHYAEIWDRFNTRLSILAATDAPALLGMLLHGTHGALIGIGAIEPSIWSAVLEDAMSGRAEGARTRFNRQCLPLMASVFQNQEPSTFVSEAGATKEALAQLGQLSSAVVRPPSVDVDDRTRGDIRIALEAAGLLDPTIRDGYGAPEFTGHALGASRERSPEGSQVDEGVL